ncbi:membrane protein involved in the export of O-antigen and teichoic acid [Fervidobacterium pennivorans DSM 9078]|uniref:Membrane protein involved in the export of O-antigen and teichoic acid n=1 Tax=Fervidobacterium pennivorans (strain DSM 9078 / Ven5) TaxID=771875 RepID=H9UCG8_FERPD|nr:oligosaccharide flippase family protein [Fervidobacterium pennivorans]AFG35211.1 membrane protein involved in the export of O-antigen and teichoic acid [Fervidobacterium pennivorans DSM 9078]
MTIKNYIKGFFSFSIGTWLRAVISFVSTPIISYLIVPEEFGKASMFTLVYNISLIISTIGLDQSFVRFYNEVEEEERGSLFWECILFPFLISILISSVFIVFEGKTSTFLFQIHYPFIGWFLSLSLITGLFQRFNELSVRMQKRGLVFSAIQIISALFNVIITILYAKFISADFYAIIAGQIGGNIAALLYGLLTDKENRKISRVNVSNIKKYLSYGLPFIPTFLITWLFTSMDRISLRYYSTFNEMGLYTAAFKLVSVMNLIQTGFTTYWVPVAYEKYSKEPENKDFYRKAFLVVSLVMYIFGLLVIGFKDIIFLLFAKSYREASYIAPFLILMPIMYTISETTVMGINFKKKTYWHIVIAATSALANFVGNTLLVPILGGKGAAISTGLSYIVFFSMRTLISKRLYDVKYDLSKIVVSNIVIVIVALIGTFRRSTLETILSALVGILVVLLLYHKELKYLMKTQKISKSLKAKFVNK